MKIHKLKCPEDWDPGEWEAYLDCEAMRRSFSRPPPGCWLGLGIGAAMLLAIVLLVA